MKYMVYDETKTCLNDRIVKLFKTQLAYLTYNPVLQSIQSFELSQSESVVQFTTARLSKAKRVLIYFGLFEMQFPMCLNIVSFQHERCAVIYLNGAQLINQTP